MKQSKTRFLSISAILGATATLLMLIEFPLWFAPSFYKLDFSEIPVLIGAFSLGPLAGILIEAIKVFLNFVINGTITYGIGELANFLIGIAFVVPAAIIYKRAKSKTHAIVGMGVGVLSMALIGALLNAFVLLPIYAKVFYMSIPDLIAFGTLVNPNITSMTTFIMLAVVPFNLLKGIFVSAVVILIYKRISPLIKGRDEDYEETN